MPKFTVHLIEIVSTSVEVEADNYEEAMESKWNAVAVSGEDGEEVWRERSDFELLTEANEEMERLRAHIAELEAATSTQK